MINLIGIKSNKGYYITDHTETRSYNLSSYFINGNHPEPTFHRLWFFVKDKPEKMEYLKSRPNINQRYELVDKSLSNVFKEVYLKDEVDFGYDEDDNKMWLPEFEKLRSLYEFKSDPQEPVMEDVEFSFTLVQEIEEIKEPSKLYYKRIGEWNKVESPITSSNLKFDMISEIITPSLLLHTQPCKLTSKESYDIVRAYIKDNIDPKVAEIKSDYDFCFTVNKKIKLAKEHVYKVDVNNNIFSSRKKKPKYETRIQKATSVQVFEMTYSPENYRNYTPIKPFEAENQDALKEYIDNYLSHLISVINEPLEECAYCNGTGVKSIEQ